jgi:hypothetical protein
LVADGRGHQVINEAPDGGTTVLIITRRAGERIMVGDDIVVEIMEMRPPRPTETAG